VVEVEVEILIVHPELQKETLEPAELAVVVMAVNPA
jgi:hypothetical protein